MNTLHFLRPEWFFALLPLTIVLLFLLLKKRNQAHWRSVIDPQLMPYVLIGKTAKNRTASLLLLACAGLAAITALAGPCWERLPTPVFRSQSALVIGLDLSLSMDSTDLKPSRLTRARLKITDILKQRQEGQTGLIVFAAEAYTVTPLTDDTDTINSQLSSLSTSIMPAQGSRPDSAIRKAIELFQQASVKNGSLLLLTDGGESPEIEKAIAALVEAGHTISIMGVGTAAGAPIVMQSGGFVTDRDGNIVIPKLNEMQLRSYALQGGGRYRGITTDDSDTSYLLSDQNPRFAETQSTDIQTDHWREEGPWLVLLLLPLATLVFRRGFLCLMLILMLPLPQPAQAISWNELWLNADQRGKHAYQQEQHAEAAELFQDPAWKASAYFRSGQYEKSLHALEGIETADAFYNKGNALAKLGNIAEAINSYQKALTLDPEHEDAQYNLDLLKKLQQQQDPQQSPQSDSAQSEQQSQQQQPQDSADSGESAQNPADQTQSQQHQSGSQQTPQEKGDNSEQASATENAENDNENNNSTTTPVPANKEQNAQETAEPQNAMTSETQETPLSEEQQATEQWLRRIPDDPGGLLRRKFRYQYGQGKQQQEQEPW